MKQVGDHLIKLEGTDSENQSRKGSKTEGKNTRRDSNLKEPDNGLKDPSEIHEIEISDLNGSLRKRKGKLNLDQALLSSRNKITRLKGFCLNSKVENFLFPLMWFTLGGILWSIVDHFILQNPSKTK